MEKQLTALCGSSACCGTNSKFKMVIKDPSRVKGDMCLDCRRTVVWSRTNRKPQHLASNRLVTKNKIEANTRFV